MDSLGMGDRDYLNQAKFALSVEYEAASDGEPDPEWTRQKGMSKQHVAAEKIRLVNLSLWLARPSWLAFKMVVSAVAGHDADWVLRHAYDVDPIRPHAQDAKNALAIADLESAKTLADCALAIPVHSPVWRAVLLLWSSLGQIDANNRYLFLWIGLEAVFGPRNPSEITHQLSQRLAFFLADSRVAAGEMYRRVKDAYRLRSKIVHGLQVYSLPPAARDALLLESESWIRAALRKIVIDADLRHTFESETRREAFLDGLAFSDT